MKEENRKFTDWYNSLQGYERRYIARQICRLCEIARPTLYRWIAGESDIKNPYRVVINEIAGEQLFETEKINIPVHH